MEGFEKRVFAIGKEMARDIGSTAIASLRNRLVPIDYRVNEDIDTAEIVVIDDIESVKSAKELLPYADDVSVSDDALRRFDRAQPVMENLEVDGASLDRD